MSTPDPLPDLDRAIAAEYAERASKSRRIPNPGHNPEPRSIEPMSESAKQAWDRTKALLQSPEVSEGPQVHDSPQE